ncbi:hypothetical protein FZEAL_2078 [Fusarium zealandicum]|uniref:Peptidase M43 pregnancy-associated plasma-A domain-containing protein n=1 Tax=Fusarium zealandicum TaxID=1053134 RepID=A0A8H4URM2_9HYPO|nr:hypothetical protein FZEAL_2078 [Fusarium zealandicum]
MVSKALFTLLLGSSGVVAHLLARGVPPRCALPDPTAEQLDNTANLRKIEQSVKFAKAPISVDTYFHVVSSSASKYISQSQLQDQLEYMNQAYAPHDVSFNLVDTTFTTNSNWAAGNNEVAMKRQLRQGDYSTLNLYFVDVAKLDGFEALGYCYFPEPGVTTNSQVFIKDGCVIVAETVPGGSSAPFNMGGTAVHEVGHWFNLFHTFQDGCTGGDLVSDTPAQARMTSGCPVRMDTCPNQPGNDPIHNYMDYSDDICYEEFTAGQEVRIHSAWNTYRQ